MSEFNPLIIGTIIFAVIAVAADIALVWYVFHNTIPINPTKEE